MKKSVDRYVLLEVVGTGQFGEVRKACDRSTGELFAVKIVKEHRLKETRRLQELVINEARVLSKLQHPNIVRFVEIMKTSHHLYLVYEYCAGGTLSQLLQKQPHQRFSVEQALSAFSQLHSGYCALLQAQILHRDLKPTNILLEEGVLKIADFGFCKEISEGDLAVTILGSPIYMAPEVLQGEAYDARADLWSLGIILFEMLHGHVPFTEQNIAKLIVHIQQSRLPLNPQLPQGLKRLLMALLQVQPERRLSTSNFQALKLTDPRLYSDQIDDRSKTNIEKPIPGQLLINPGSTPRVLSLEISQQRRRSKSIRQNPTQTPPKCKANSPTKPSDTTLHKPFSGCQARKLLRNGVKWLSHWVSDSLRHVESPEQLESVICGLELILEIHSRTKSDSVYWKTVAESPPEGWDSSLEQEYMSAQRLRKNCLEKLMMMPQAENSGERPFSMERLRTVLAESDDEERSRHLLVGLCVYRHVWLALSQESVDWTDYTRVNMKVTELHRLCAEVSALP